MADITDTELQQLLSEGLTQSEIARHTGIPRSTVRRRLEKLGTPQVDISVQIEGTPVVHQGLPQPTQDPESNEDLRELLEWWNARKRALQTKDDPEQETERKTYHVQKRYIEAIQRAADLERVSITEIVNRAFKQFFADRT
jgi:DNA-binding transcriptional regulator LsrR (DeoR family)